MTESDAPVTVIEVTSTGGVTVISRVPLTFGLSIDLAVINTFPSCVPVNSPLAIFIVALPDIFAFDHVTPFSSTSVGKTTALI